MIYRHGVYTGERATRIRPASAIESCIPFVIGTCLTDDSRLITGTDEDRDFKPMLCRTLSDYAVAYNPGDTEDDYIEAYDGADPETLSAFARHWFARAGLGACIFCRVPATQAESGGEISISDANFSKAMTALNTVFSQTGMIPTVVVCPRYGAAHASVLARNVNAFDSGFSALGVTDIKYTWNIGGTATKPATSGLPIVLCSPRGTYGKEIVDRSIDFVAVMGATDLANGGLPFRSPSNVPSYLDGMVDESGDPLFMSQDNSNVTFNKNGIVTGRYDARGWIAWGDETSVFPEETDPKDAFIACRRMFSYVRNLFILTASPRIDMPINRRQLDGVIDDFNARLKGLLNAGALNSAYVVYSTENTPEDLLAGRVKIDTYIAPPPPAREIENSFEYDVEGFVASLA